MKNQIKVETITEKCLWVKLDLKTDNYWIRTGKSLSEALFRTWGEHVVYKYVLNVRNNICTQYVLPRFELGIFMY